jgi:hypothetical protein
MSKRYDVDYFIAKFSAIPAKRWTTRTFDDSFGRRCAGGHCGMRAGDRYFEVPEYRALVGIVSKALGTFVSMINDGLDPRFKQKTPRGRILAALRLAKKKLQGGRR